MYRWPFDIDPVKSERTQRKLRELAAVILTIAVTITALAAVLAYSVPFSTDLYNEVYANSRPKKGENTYFFLFVFPLFLWVQGTILWLDPGRQLVRRCQKDGMIFIIIAWNALGGIVFCVAALIRLATVWRWYF